MKTVLKSLVESINGIRFEFSPALTGLAKAGDFNFEDINSIKTDDTPRYEKQSRGPIFNFSFGGSKDYKKTNPLVAMMDEIKVWSVVGFAAVIDIIVLTINQTEEDTLTIELSPEPDLRPENYSSFCVRW